MTLHHLLLGGFACLPLAAAVPQPPRADELPAPTALYRDFVPQVHADGAWLLLLGGEAPSWLLLVYERAEGGSYVPRGMYLIVSPVLKLEAEGMRVDASGVTVRLTRRASGNSSELEVTHRFTFDRPVDGFRFMGEDWAARDFLQEFEEVAEEEPADDGKEEP